MEQIQTAELIQQMSASASLSTKNAVGAWIKSAVKHEPRKVQLEDALEKSCYFFWNTLTEFEFSIMPKNIQMTCMQFMADETKEFFDKATMKDKTKREFTEAMMMLDAVKDPLPAPVDLEIKDWDSRAIVKQYMERLLSVWKHNSAVFNSLHELKKMYFMKVLKDYPNYRMPPVARDILTSKLNEYKKVCIYQREKLEEIKSRKGFDRF